MLKKMKYQIHSKILDLNYQNIMIWNGDLKYRCYIGQCIFNILNFYILYTIYFLQIASRTLLKQVAPLITLDLSIKNSDKDENIEHILLQTDPINLSYITQQLEEAVQEGYSQHIRRLSRVIK